jgi:H2-forming N5,N10-methylenetetrahydromethanopterin dehydrogenase-like enzyme
VTYPGFTPVGNATLVVANVLTCNKHSQKNMDVCATCRMQPIAVWCRVHLGAAVWCRVKLNAAEG